jgi:hypothetical protein
LHLEGRKGKERKGKKVGRKVSGSVSTTVYYDITQGSYSGFDTLSIFLRMLL